ncbi:MAG: hypothetical protein OEV30_08985, partial [Ignavibacteria bacterium]|nr:hypothetical protein [Ignavibacteria bacterium]
QPEGTTQTLQEFDKVFVQLKGTNFDVVLGDFNIEFEGTQFARLNRKLQGARASGSLGSPTDMAGKVTVSGAVPRGKFHSVQFNGIEGVQGPYVLTGRNGEKNIIVIAGTERVFVNGVQMVRGEINDYTIDYSLSEITFASGRLITAASRIVIDFEYTDRQYGRTFLAGEGRGSFFGEQISFGVSAYREADDQDDPIDVVLSDSARQILADAGDDRNKAVVSGVALVDSNGFYVRIDSLVAGEATTFYRYQPGSDARYVVTFSFVGSSQGDYTESQPGVFRWVGKGMGSYLPIRFLPLPQAHTLIDYNLTLRPSSDVRITGELAHSRFDANTFSTLDYEDDNGHAFDVAALFAPKDIRVFGKRIGSAELEVKGRFIEDTFVPIDRINVIEFTRKWGIDTLRTLDETSREAGLLYMPVPSISIGGKIGSLERGDVTSSERRELTASIADSAFPIIRYLLEDVDSRDTESERASRWLRQNGTAEYRMGGIVPMLRYEQEKRTVQRTTDDSLAQGSFRFDLIAPGIRFIRLGPLDLRGEYEWRADDLFDPSSRRVARAFDTFTQTYQLAVRGVREFSTTLDVTLRNRDVTPLFESMGNQDIRTVLLRNQSRYTTPDRWLDATTFYEVATQQSSTLQRVFVRVTPGSGNYRYLGDLNNNGIADESEFELTRYDGDFVVITVPTREFVPIIDLKTSFRLGLRPEILFQGSNGWFAGALSAISTETYIRIDEKSTEPDLANIYLLRFSYFRNDSTTLAGSQLFTQDLNLFERSPGFSTRFRYQERKSLIRFSDGPERRYVREQSIRIRTQPVEEFSQQFDFIRKRDDAGSTSAVRPDHDILSDAFLFDLAYRPEQRIELGLQIELGTAEDQNPAAPSSATINGESVRLIYSFEGVGQARGQLTREEVKLTGSSGTVPFELTDGRAAGRTWLWNIGFDYRITRFIQAALSYSGRSEEGARTVHTANAEVQAFF